MDFVCVLWALAVMLPFPLARDLARELLTLQFVEQHYDGLTSFQRKVCVFSRFRYQRTLAS